jgi:lipopolysaccharide transport system ATP-binding protein
VLAVGDAAFQKKCLGRMRGVARNGRTVLFVSHNLAAVQQLCDRCIVLERGRVRHDGTVGEGVGVYLEMMKREAPPAEVDCRGLAARSTTDEVQLVRASLHDAGGRATPQVAFGAPLEIRVTIDVKRPVHDLSLGAGVSSLDGIRLFTSESRATLPLAQLEAGVHRFRLHWEGLCLRPGLYAIDVGFNADEGRAYLAGVLQLEILDATDADSRAVIDRRPGLVLNTMPWTCDTMRLEQMNEEALCVRR